MKTKLAVLYGGASGEHTVSIKSAFSILSNLDYDKFEAKPIYINKENEWFEQKWFNQVPTTEDELTSTRNEHLNPFSISSMVDVVFPITHGPFGEDGHFQAILEMLNIPYVGCDLLSSAIGMDKAIMKDLFVANNIPQGKYLYFSETDFASNPDAFLTKVEQELEYPCFIKPANLGSSVGISKANNRIELVNGLGTAFEYDTKVVVEEFIQGREIEIGVLGNNPYTLSVIGEIRTKADFYDFDAKYLDTKQNELLIPTVLPSHIEEQVHQLADRVAKVINVKGLSRIDFFYVESKDVLYVNEINTLPGFTKHSMYPSLFAEIGIAYKDLISRLVSLAVENHKTKKRYKK
ncbi:D-alanine--D-alanine ligase family protein [Bacillus cereus]|uniref:D-alanine--D-alanine ligase family protein n=1 Tax=Bacillus cereus TaxID=1396 RepID=UPI0015961988|nr:D-alanine--D-alanine ligase family protein [Bacillus cereus]